MAREAAFEAHHRRYEDWFETHELAYISELLALRPLVPWKGRGLEIGVGSARFAAPLGVQVGVDPSPAMLAYAAARGVQAVAGTAEELPFVDGCFDHALVVTTICFVDSAAAMIAEAYRVLRPGAPLVIGFIDRDSPLGRRYELHQEEDVFYREATFYSAAEVERLLRNGGFRIEHWGQTLASARADVPAIDPLRPGRGRCGFVVVAAERPA
ncbi:class I SAM-dependent methyltransferase [Arhodomonas sp. SL1]|uniref:class I SAM-dependent methyltransferase n=1 Tax=Arhodomonas sp. SL1 TaxID=3425691 RepID=UPI003F885499